jgi:hypothetical protein
MAFLHNVRTVALYEAKTLRRSWFFRLFSIGALFIFTILNIGMFSPIGDESWSMISIPSSVPLVNLYLLNIGQAIVVIFLAADFLKRDKKLDTNEVLYTRSMSNFEYIIGKTWGILRLFLGLDLLILLIGLAANITSKAMTIDFAAYLSYLVIICVPTIIFSLGLAFVIMSVIRNQAVTFMLLLGYAALVMFYLYFRMGSLFDYLAIGLPVFKSGIIGFDNLGFILNQRFLYMFLGLAMVLTTVLLFRRLPQSRVHRIFTFVFLFIFLAASAVCGFNTYMSYRNSNNDKQTVININRQFENKDFADMTDAALVFIHKGKTFEGTADIKILNDNDKSIDHYYFSLNPSLTVSKVTSAGKDLPFKRFNHIIDIEPGKTLDPGQRDSLIIEYNGSINEAFCYPNYSDNIKENRYRIQMVNVNKRQAFLTDNYVLLTPETHWYPTPGLNYYPSNPARIKVDYTRFTLRAMSQKNIVAVSQGNKIEKEGLSVFKPESPLTGLTLVMGNYLTEKKKIDSVEYITCFFPGHDYYKKDLSQIKDTLSFLVSGIMRELETNFSTKYPFKTLTLIEVPVQFYSFPKKNTQTRAELQPSMVLLPEKLSTLDQAGFARQFKRQKRNMARNNQIITDKELQVRIFNNFIRYTFISGTNFRFINGVALNEPTRYLMGPSFYFFKNNFYSSDYPVINAVFESHLQKVSTPGRPPGLATMFGNLSDNDKANLILKGMSFSDLLARNPGSDTLRAILTIKGDYFFNFIRSKAGIEEFKTWFLNYIDNHKFQRINILQLNSDIREKFGFEFYPYLNEWFNRKEQPGFLITNLKANEIVVNNRSRYQVTFTASNPEPVGGLFNISFRTGGPGARGGGGPQMMAMTVVQGGGGGGGRMQISMQGRGMEAADISKIIFMGPNEAKKIGIVLDAQPRAMMINTLFAKNIPGEITMPINDIVKSKDITNEFQGEETLSSIPPFSESFEIIVDNEDPGFIRSKQENVNPLKKLLGIKNQSEDTYQVIRPFNVPEFWQPVVLTSYYGKYIRSAVYTRKGTGDKSVTWAAIIPSPGYYDIYTFIGKTSDRVTIRTGAGAGPGGPGGPGGQGGQMGQQQAESQYKDFHYKIYHDEGVEEITLDYENAEAGWNKLGTYYLSPDTAKVVLTNLSAGRMVLGDAMKWVKQR